MNYNFIAMPRPPIPRRIRFNPEATYFKPRGIPLRSLDEIILRPDEMEALRLYDLKGLDQTTASEQMHISQPTFARILSSARKKVAEALVLGKAIRLEGLQNPHE